MPASTTKIVSLVIGVSMGVAAIGIALCGGLMYMGYKDANTAVSPQIDSLLAAIESGTADSTYDTHTSEELRTNVSREDYVAACEEIGLRMGRLKSKSRQGFKMRYLTGESIVDVTYAAEFEKGPGTIIARLKRHGDEWRIILFRVKSPVLKQASATLECQNCGRLHEADAKFCPSCGEAISGRTNGKDGDDTDASQ